MKKGVRECENHMSSENRCRPGGGGWVGNWWLRSNKHFTVYTLHPAPHKPYTLHPIHPTPYTLHPTPHGGTGWASRDHRRGRGGSCGVGVGGGWGRELNSLGLGGGIGMREEMYGARIRVQSPGSRVHGPGSSVQCPVFRVQGPGSKIQFF